MPRPLSAISDAEKIAAFDKLYNDAIEYVEEVRAGKYEDSDTPHYIFERAMVETLGKDIFQRVINPLMR